MHREKEINRISSRLEEKGTNNVRILKDGSLRNHEPSF